MQALCNVKYGTVSIQVWKFVFLSLFINLNRDTYWYEWLLHLINKKINQQSLERTRSMAAPFFCAYAPHSMKTRPSRLVLSHCTTASVNVSHPLSLCELAWCARTVNTAFSSRTPAKSRRGSRERGRQSLRHVTVLFAPNHLNIDKFSVYCLGFKQSLSFQSLFF